jgi:hypothetical protein
MTRPTDEPAQACLPARPPAAPERNPFGSFGQLIGHWPLSTAVRYDRHLRRNLKSTCVFRVVSKPLFLDTDRPRTNCGPERPPLPPPSAPRPAGRPLTRRACASCGVPHVHLLSFSRNESAVSGPSRAAHGACYSAAVRNISMGARSHSPFYSAASPGPATRTMRIRDRSQPSSPERHSGQASPKHRKIARAATVSSSACCILRYLYAEEMEDKSLASTRDECVLPRSTRNQVAPGRPSYAGTSTIAHTHHASHLGLGRLR